MNIIITHSHHHHSHHSGEGVFGGILNGAACHSNFVEHCHLKVVIRIIQFITFIFLNFYHSTNFINLPFNLDPQ